MKKTFKLFIPLYYLYNYKYKDIWSVMQSNLSDSEITYIKNYILTYCPPGYLPILIFLLSPESQNGNIIDNNFSKVNIVNLKMVINKIAFFREHGIYVIPCLYGFNSILSLKNINNTIHNLKLIHNYINQYISGYVISIESNQLVDNISDLKNAFNLIKNELYAKHLEYLVHLQYKAKNLYWIKEDNLFKELRFIIVKNSWPTIVAKDLPITDFTNEIEEIVNNNPNKKLIFSDYSYYTEYDNYKQQRNKLIELANKYPNIVGIG